MSESPGAFVVTVTMTEWRQGRTGRLWPLLEDVTPLSLGGEVSHCLSAHPDHVMPAPISREVMCATRGGKGVVGGVVRGVVRGRKRLW